MITEDVHEKAPAFKTNIHLTLTTTGKLEQVNPVKVCKKHVTL